MADALGHGRGRDGLPALIVRLREVFAGRRHGLHIVLAVRIAQVQPVDRAGQDLQRRLPVALALGQEIAALIGHRQVVVELGRLHILVFQGQCQGRHGLALRERRAVTVKQDEKTPAAHRLRHAQFHGGVVDVQRLFDPAVHTRLELRICRVPQPFAPGDRAQQHASGEVLRHQDLKAEILPGFGNAPFPTVLKRPPRTGPGCGLNARHGDFPNGFQARKLTEHLLHALLQ